MPRKCCKCCRILRQNRLALAVSGALISVILLLQLFTQHHVSYSSAERHGQQFTKQPPPQSAGDPDIAFMIRQKARVDLWDSDLLYIIRKLLPRMETQDLYRYNTTVSITGRLGNIMFEYASLLGISDAIQSSPCVPDTMYLDEFFEIDTPECDADIPWTDFTEASASAFDPQISRLHLLETNIRLNGFFQSWQYFQHIEHRIRQQFRFKDIILKHASRFMRRAIQKHYGVNITRDEVTLIGVHVRRSDMLTYGNILAGYTVATKEYIRVALSYFEATYSSRRPLFVVCSDDPEWSKLHVLPSRAPLVLSEGNHALVDLALLSMCDHSIITVGTFGWWGAWLAGGRTLYYKDFPARYSSIDKDFSHQDFYPPHWIGISFLTPDE